MPITSPVEYCKHHPGQASVLIAVVLYAVLGFFVAPWLLDKILVETLRDDFNAELRMEKVEINPFVLSLRVTGLELDDPAAAPTARVEEIFVNFQLSSIFRLAWTFDELRVSAPELFLARDGAGELNIAYLMPPPAANESDKQTDADKETAALIQTLVFNFAIEDFVLNWRDEATIEPVDTRLGPIEVRIQQLNTIPDRAGQQSVMIATENQGSLSWTGNLQLNPLLSSGHARLEGSRFPLVSAYIRHQAGADIVEGSANAELDYQVSETADGSIQASIENFNMSFLDVVVRTFADGTGFDFAGDDQEMLRLPKIQLQQGRFVWPQQTVSLESLSIDDAHISLTRSEEGVLSLEPRPAPAAANASASVPAESADNDDDATKPWQVSVANLAINGMALNLLDRGVSPETTLGFKDFNLKVSAISNQPGQSMPASLDLQLLSGGKLSLQGEAVILPQPIADFDVDIEALELSGAQPYISQMANIRLNSGAMNLAGKLKHSADDPLAFSGDLEILGLEIAEAIDGKRIGSWKRFLADNMALSLANRQIDISEIQFERLYGDILIAEDKSLNLGKIARADTATGADTPKQPETGEPGPEADSRESEFKVNIGRVVLTDASADFADLSLPLPFAVKIDTLNGNMTTISTESSEPSEVSLEGKVDEYGLARVSGTVTPLDPTRNTDLLVSFQNIYVPKFTPYSIPFAGREVASGNLDLKLGYQVKDSELVGENSLVLRDFELGKEVPHPDAMSLPLGLAVALLKDKDGRISIDLPVRGNVDEPDFSYGGVVMKALGDLLAKIVLSPFSALARLLGMEASELEHINFVDGRSDLTPPEQEKILKLSEALALRPELQLVISGASDPRADGLALRTARLDAAVERRVSELKAAGAEDTGYAELRMTALDRLFMEQPGVADPALVLDGLRADFTALVEVEGQTEPVPKFDGPAYSNDLRSRLIEMQVVDAADLAQLATARAEATREALVAISADLLDRITIGENESVEREEGETVQMKLNLGSKSE